MALKVGELFASFNLDTSGVGSAVKGAEKTLSGMGKSLAIGGAAMSAAITAPLVAAGKDIYKAGSGFDAQMSKVFAIAGDEVTGSAEAMDALRAKALEMGSTTQFTASEAGQAFEYMAMAGWKTESMLAGIEPLMNLAAAAGADLGTTSDIVTDAMTAFGLSATDMVSVVKDGVQQSVPAVEYFADILAATSSNSNTNVTMLGESFKFAAPLAGAFGYTLNDTALALGLMANNGIKGSMAGTSLSRVIQNMTKPSKETAEAMEELGVSLYDSKGQVKPLREVMMDFRNVAKKNGVDVSKLSNDVAELSGKLEKGEISEKEYEKQLAKLTDGSGDFMKYVTQIAGARGLPGLLAIMNASEEDFLKLSGSIDNATGSAKKMKEVMLDNVQGDMTIFKSAVEGLEITLWDLVKGPVRGLIQRGTKLADTFRTMDKDTLRGAIRMAGFAAAIGPVMTASGGLLVALPKVARAITRLASPAGLVAISLLALGAAAMDAENLMGKNLEKMAAKASKSSQQLQKELFGKDKVLAGRAKAFLNSVQTAITTALPDMMDALSAVLTTSLNAITEVLPEAGETATTFVTTLATSLASNMPELVQSLAGTLTALATTVIESAPDMLNAGVTLFTSLIDALGKVNWAEIGTKINGAVKTALAEIRTNFYKLVFGEEPKEGDLGDWGKLGSKLVENIKAGIKTASDNGKNLLGGLTMGDDYTPETTWAQVGAKIWDVIKSGITTVGDWIKQLVLGKNYTPDASWSAVGSAIWAKIKTGFTAVGDWVKRLVMGKEYTPDNTWSDVGKKIWDRIKSGITVTGDWLKTKLGYTPSDSWSTVGSGIWKKIKSGISDTGDWLKAKLGYKATDDWKTVGSGILAKIKEGIGTAQAFATSILEKIGTVEIDVEKVQAVVKNAGTFVSNLIGNMLNGKIKWGTKITDIASKIAEQLRTFDWSGVGTDLGMSAANMVRGMIDMIPKAVDAAGKALDLGAELAGGLLDAIVSGITAIANSGLGNKLGDTAVQLVHGILNNITNLGTNPDVMGFMEKLGQGFSDAMGMLGDIAGKIIAYIFSPQGLSDIFNASITLGGLILKGIEKGIGGLDKFLKRTIRGTLINWGVLTEEEVKAAETAGEKLADATNQALKESASGKLELDAGQELLINWANWRGGQNRDEITPAAQDMVTTFEGALKGALKGSDSGETFRDAVVQQMLMANKELETQALELNIDLGDPNLNWVEVAKQLGYNVEELLPNFEDLDFWASLRAAVESGSQSEIMNLASQMLTAAMTKAQEQATEAAAESGEKAAEKIEYVPSEVQSALAEINATTAQAATETAAGVSEITDAMEKGSNELAKNGMATAIANSADKVDAAALSVSDKVVKDFLLTMSMENGYLIGDNFVLALGSGMTAQSEAVSGIAKSIGGASRGALANAASYSIGERIGANFGQGFVNGIESKIADAAAAAARLGMAGTSGLSASIQEGSPSKLTAMSGVNFDLGFINAILSRADDAADAAGLMGANAARALEYTAHGMGEEAIRQTDYPQKSGYTRSAEAYRSQTRDAGDGDIADRIAEALNGIGLYFDGEAAGHILTRYISEEIARGAAMRR